MKKFFIIIAAIITMMMACAGPIMIKAHAESELTVSKERISQDTNISFNDDDYEYAFCNILYYDPYSDPHEKVYAVSVNISKEAISNFTFTYENDQLIIISPGTDSIPLFYFVPDNNKFTRGSRHCNKVIFDFNTNHLSAFYLDGSDVDIYGLVTDYYNFDTNIEEYQSSSLDLSVTFKPDLSGAISRTQTIDGKEYTSKTLDMIIKNNGTDAQFSMFIVDKGQNITFPASSIQNNQGFNGTAVYAYVSDEWSSFSAGLLGSSVYAPCAWHTIAAGFNQTYSIYWEQISLEANKEYDVVVYGCLNDNAVQTNTSSQWDMRPVYTVTSSLNDVQEVYRSTFSITDPAEFNPNFVDEGNSVHAWNPNADNSSLFNTASAYRDDNGNVVIKGQTGGGNNIFSADLNTQNINANVLFGDTFKFFTSFLGQCPPAWVAILTVGLSAIVAVAIVKKVT